MKTNILFCDTETTGKCDFKASPTAPHQPRIVQLAALMTDNQGRTAGQMCVIIKPDGWTISPEALAVHGISMERAEAEGVTIKTALAMFEEMSWQCAGHVCHNSDFDSRLIAGERARAGYAISGAQYFCTMKAMTKICQLPGPYGMKWPSLAEAYRHCFNREMEKAHDAMADTTACKEIYFWMKNRKA